MKKLLIIMLIAGFSGFAWLSLPRPDPASGIRQQIANGAGVILGVDIDKGLVTISHGALPALNMMPMTMEFTVREKRQLANLLPAQRVEFQLAYDGKDYLIIDIR
jgi:Cu/Ag efflux protein CusF